MQALDEFQFRADADLVSTAARRTDGVRRFVRSVEVARGRARLPRPARSRARSAQEQRRGSHVISRVASGGSSSTSSRTPIHCRRSCCSCSPPMIRPRRAGTRSFLFQANSSSLAIRSSRSIGSGVQTWTSIGVCAQMLVDRGATRVELRKSFRSVPNIQQRRERRVCAPDGRRSRYPSGDVRRARARRARTTRISRRSSSASAGALRSAVHRRARDREVLCPTRSAPTSTGS